MGRYRINGEVIQADSPEQAAEKYKAGQQKRPGGQKTSPMKGTALNPLGSGAMLGLTDELSGALGAIPASIATGNPVSEAYAGIRDKVRSQQKDFATRNPGTSLALNIAGALPTGLVGGARLVGQAPSIPRMGAVGAGESGVAGFGEAEGSMKDQALQTAFALPLGLALGLSGGVAGRLYDKMTGPQSVPQKVIQKGMDADLLDPQTAVAKAQAMGPEATPIDVGGEGMVFLGQQVAGASPASRAMADRALVSGRRATQTNRIMDSIEDATGLRPEYGLATDQMEEVVAQRTEGARELWAAVNEMPIPLTKTLDNALDQNVVKQAFRRGQEEASLSGRNLPPIYEVNEAGDLVKTGVAPDTEAWTTIKSHIDSVLRESSKYTDPVTGRPTKLGLSMQKFRNKLVGELKKENSAYGPALDQWAGESAIIDAISEGKNILSSSQWVSDVQRLAKNMAKSEKEGYLAGAVNAVRERMGRPGGEGSISEFNFMESPNFQAKLRAFLPEGASGDKKLKTLIDRFKTERRFKDVGTKVSQGSQTAFRDEATRMLDPMAREGGFMKSVASGNLGEAATNLVRDKIGKIAGGVPSGTKDRIAELIFQPGGTEQLVKFLESTDLDQNKINSLIALTRQIPGALGAGTTTGGMNPGSELMQNMAGMTTGY